MNMFMYCSRCGLIKNMKGKEMECPACETALEAVPPKYLTVTGLMFASQAARKEFEEMIRSSEAYDAGANLQSERLLVEKEKIRNQEIEKKVEVYKSSKQQKHCLVCHSTQISKISNIGKGAKVMAFGILGAGDIGKTWKCNTCGYKF